MDVAKLREKAGQFLNQIQMESVGDVFATYAPNDVEGNYLKRKMFPKQNWMKPKLHTAVPRHH